jgi:hypothetical protein
VTDVISVLSLPTDERSATSPIPLHVPLPHTALRVLPLAILRLRELKWPGGRALDTLTGEIVYGPVSRGLQSATIEVLCARWPVLHRGAPRAALIVHRSDARTRLLIANRLERLLMDLAGPSEPVEVHDGANAPLVHDTDTGAVVITVDWTWRVATARLVAGFLEEDPEMRRVVLRGAMGSDRWAYDHKVLTMFATRGGGVERHFSGPQKLLWRFSDFTVSEFVLPIRGVRFDITFEDYEVLDFAVQKFEEVIAPRTHETEPSFLAADGRAHGQPLRLTSNVAAPGCMNTDLMWKDMRLSIRGAWNGRRTRGEMCRFLRATCGLDAVSQSEFNRFLA